MNARIKQLAEQAGMTDDKYGMFFAKDKHDEDGVDLEKFAELLIQECADIADNQEDYLTAKIIKQQFGVE
jgi:hypothetical protein